MSDPHCTAGMPAFSEVVREWFAQRFGAPTPVQAKAWELIARGDNVLVTAPTGSGKTLAAFLWSIDRLMERAQVQAADALGQKGSGVRGAGSENRGKEGDLKGSGKEARGVKVLYVSPLKALGADVDKNLRRPLAQIAHLAGFADAPVSVAQRTGDTPPEVRRRILRKPPDILITTPESLYLMLTSQARRVLSDVDTVIVDEIHSILGTKRGAHLALSLERLDNLLHAPCQRIGLSATVRPIETAMEFLGGVHPVSLAEQEELPAFDLSIEVPVPDMTAVGISAVSAQRLESAPPRKVRRAPIEEAWKSDRALRAAMAGAPMPSPEHRSGSPSLWPHIEAAVLDEVLTHGSTIVFVNSRGLCERLTARLNELYARRCGMRDGGQGLGAYRSELGSTVMLAAAVEDADVAVARAHHGSVSKADRLDIEARLKEGSLRCVVATSSLELGIDMGSVDLVIQIAPPLSVASGLQRIGRAGHSVGGRSRGIIIPRTRAELIDAAVIAEAMAAGAVEPIEPVLNALDVLAQQTVAAVAMEPEGLSSDEWFATVRRAFNFARLPRKAFDSVIDMLAGRFADGVLSPFAARIYADDETGMLTARANSQRLAVGGAGTIPDRGLYSVVLPEGEGRRGRKRVGELDEEMVHESRVGDVITLGTSTWRIKEIGADRVVVEPSSGRASRLPFWHGDAPSRPYETGRAKGAFLRDALSGLGAWEEEGLAPETAASEQGRPRRAGSLDARLEKRWEEAGLTANARSNLGALLAEQRACCGALPTDKTLICELGVDETGGWRIILHSPFGRKVHEPWALAVAERMRRQGQSRAHAAAADDGIILSLPASEDEPCAADLFRFDPDELEATVRASLGATSLFAARFRECAARALLMTPSQPGKRTPLWQQRIKGGRLLEAVRELPDFPLLAEAARECLGDAFDMAALRKVMSAVAAGTIRIRSCRPPAPSPLAGPLIFGYTMDHLYDGDMPQAEQSAALLSLDADVLSELLGSQAVTDILDPQESALMELRLQRIAEGYGAKGADGMLDMLTELGPLDTEEAAQRFMSAQGGSKRADGDEARCVLQDLEQRHLVFQTVLGARQCWAAAQEAAILHGLTGCPLPPWLAHEKTRFEGRSKEKPLEQALARYGRTHGPFTAEAAADRLGLGPGLVFETLQSMAESGIVVRSGHLWVDADVLRRLRRASLARAQAAIKPVSPQAYLSHVMDIQGLALSGRGSGIEGTAEVLALFEGVFLPMEVWERTVLPARVDGYRQAYLDELVAAGEVLWQGGTGPWGPDGPFTASRDSEESHCASRFEESPGTGCEGSRAFAPLTVGFYPTDSPLAPFAADPSDPGVDPVESFVDPEEGPWTSLASVEKLVRTGRASNDTLGFPRRAAEAKEQPARAPRTRSRRGSSTRRMMEARARERVRERLARQEARQAGMGGRWFVLGSSDAGPEAQMIGAVESLLDRYGVLCRDIALEAGVPGGLEPLRQTLRSMEDAGIVIRGRFVEGLGPVQYAARETVEALRGWQRALDDAGEEAAADDAVVLSADDPAWLLGSVVPWPQPVFGDGGAKAAKPRRVGGAKAALVDGRPVLYAAPNLKTLIVYTDDEGMLLRALEGVLAALAKDARLKGETLAAAKISVSSVNGMDADECPATVVLERAGFVKLPKAMRYYGSL